MTPANNGGTADVPAGRITPVQLEAFYAAEYPKLVKILMAMDAAMEEAEAATQEAMADFFRRSRADHVAISCPAAYVCRAAIRFFVKERQRERERLPREIKGGHLTLPAYLDDELTVCEDEQWVEHLLEVLTPAQRDVIRLVMAGASTKEIAAELGKRDATIRQHLKNGRARLVGHPEMTSRAPRELRVQYPAQGGAAATSAPGKEEVQ